MFTGRVLYVKGSGRLKGASELTVTLTSLEVAGQDYSIVTAHKSSRVTSPGSGAVVAPARSRAWQRAEASVQR